MKKTISILMLLLAGYCANAQKTGIHFEHGLSWQQLLEKAKAENKYIFVDAYATWCVPCRYMSDSIFSRQEVGIYMNSNFINVRVQLDITKNDDDDVKAAYANARQLMDNYHISSFPTYLFFSPDGKIVHRSVGASNDPESFLRKAADALDPDNQYYTELEKYKSDTRDSASMRKLALAAYKFGDDSIAVQISQQFIKELKNVYSKDNLDFIESITKSSDSYGFLLWKNHSCKVNAVMTKDYAERHVMNIIMQEDTNIIAANQKAIQGAKLLGMSGTKPIYAPLGKNVTQPSPPNWKRMSSGIEKKYGAYYAGRLTKWEMMSYYQRRELWADYDHGLINYVSIYKATVSSKQLDEFAGNICDHSDNKRQLETALKWSGTTLTGNNVNFYGFLDTHAEILYKLQQKEKAVAEEEKVLSLAPEKDRPFYASRLNQMKNGQKVIINYK
jgi:thioredoxin-related protein